MNPDAINAFQASSSVAPSVVSLLVRTLIYVTFILWGGWVIYGEYESYKHQKIDFLDLPLRIFRILFLCTMVLILVYV